MAEYLKNVWYMAGWEEEVERDCMVARTILNTPVMIYAREDGTGYVGLVDRCAHRFAPLHNGKRIGDNIQCPYHGLVFAPDGACVKNPYSDLIPPNCRVGTFAIEPRDSILWMWGGDPASADPSKIPDFSILFDGVPQRRGRIGMKAHYELLTDNLMDSTHVEFVHTPRTFGGGNVIWKGKYEVKEVGEEIWSNWFMADTRPGWASFLPEGLPMDHWIDMRWHAPASMLIDIGLGHLGKGRSDPIVPPMRGAHIITPETDTSSHYFFTYVPTHEGDSGEAPLAAFDEEDRPMIESVQRNIGDRGFWDMQPTVLHVDAGAIRARRRIQKLLREEAGAAGDVDREGALPEIAA